MDQFQRELQKVERYLSANGISDISKTEISHQLKLFIKGVKIPELIRPCTIGDGIIKLDETNFPELLKEFLSASLNGRITKFIPASGAASRMFQKLHSVVNRFPEISFDELKNLAGKDMECESAFSFLIHIKNFAFYDDLKKILNKEDLEIEEYIKQSPIEMIRLVLFNQGLDYISKPKGAIKFHSYQNESRTAFEEQILEAIHYANDKNNNVKIHFTISEQHTDLLKKIVEELRTKLNDTDFKIDVSFSYQKKSTDTIAVNLNNEIIFNNDGSILQRPSGHGALLENLDDLNGDIIVIKNIDNVSNSDLASDSIQYKKLLIGLLVKLQKKIFEYSYQLEDGKLSDLDLERVILFLKQNFFWHKPKDFDNLEKEDKRTYLIRILNRPIRVCGMVKNEGQPGGGPFWVKDKVNGYSVQIIEQAQINFNDKNQREIFQNSTHFNPVDLICGVKNYKGENFNLKDFVDYDCGIITTKFKNGIELKALELPGLWNGSMANWNTVFVEVPVSTFNPVKEVNDLLKKAHQKEN